MPNGMQAGAEVIETSSLHSLERALSNTEKERQMFNALCINFTAAYYCDLITDHMEPIKQKNFWMYT